MKSLSKSRFTFRFNGIHLGRLMKWVNPYQISNHSNNKKNNNYLLSIFFGLFSAFVVLNGKAKCIDNQRDEKSVDLKKFEDVQIFQLNKNQLVSLLSDVNQESLLVVFNKYFKNQHEKQFAKKLESLYIQALRLKIPKIYLVERNDVKHLQTFQKWLRNQEVSNKFQAQHSGSNQDKNSQQNYFLTPSFQNNPFRLQEGKQTYEQISQIRKFAPQINPRDLAEQIFIPHQKIYNRSIVIRQCPQHSQKQNKCVQEFSNKIATLIQQKMLRNKSQQFRFFVVSPNSKRDTSPLTNFHNHLKQHQNEHKVESGSQQDLLNYSQKLQNTFVLRNDVIGKQIQDMNSFKKLNYPALKELTSYEKFLLFLRPRVFTVSKANSSIDLYWYVTCLHKNKQPSISINNTDSFLLGAKHPVQDGHSYPLNRDLQFLRILYQNHPELNYVIVNTQIVSQLIRHLQIKNKYVIYSLTSNLIYPKMFLPHFSQGLSPQQNYLQNFKPMIQKYLKDPKVYDMIVMDKEKKINLSQLQQKVRQNNPKQKFILRVCSLKCQKDIQQQKMQKAYIQLAQTRSESSQTADFRQKNWKNKVFSKTYWIDSHFNFVGMKEGDYIFEDGKFAQI